MWQIHKIANDKAHAVFISAPFFVSLIDSPKRTLSYFTHQFLKLVNPVKIADTFFKYLILNNLTKIFTTCINPNAR